MRIHRLLTFSTATACLFVGLTALSHAQTKRALIIGINDYSPAGRNTPGSAADKRRLGDLQGCENDADSMQALLETRYGFKSADIVRLRTAQATRKGILDALASMAGRAQKGDTVFFYYSGHGSQKPNSATSETDKMDETIVPVDLQDISDKELAKAFNAILDKNATLTAMLDSCHSQSVSRGLPRARQSKSAEPASGDTKLPDVKLAPSDRGALVLSAAREFEPAEEDRSTKPYRGAFTKALQAAISQEGQDALSRCLIARARLKTSFDQEQVLDANAGQRAP